MTKAIDALDDLKRMIHRKNIMKREFLDLGNQLDTINSQIRQAKTDLCHQIEEEELD